MALRRHSRPAPPPPAPQAAPAAPAAWVADPGFAPVAVEEPVAGAPAQWVAAAEPIDVTDATVDMPVLAPLPRRRAARAGRVALTLVLVLGCAGGAVAASGVLKTKRHDSAPPALTGSSVIAAARPHHAKPARHRRVGARHHRAHRSARHAAAPRHVTVAVHAAPSATPAPARTPAPAPVRQVTRHPAVSKPAPKSTPKPVATKPATTPQPAASAPSGEPGRQPQPTSP